MSVDLSKITNSSGVAKSKDSVVGIGATASRTSAQALPDKGIDPNDKHLCTDYLLTNLKGRTVSGAFITIVAQGAQFVLDAPPRRQLRSVGAISRLRQGGPVVGAGGYINDLRTSASVGADLLRKAGVPDESFQTVRA